MLALCIIAAPPLHAQDMRPPIPDQIKKFWVYAGNFTGTGTMSMGDQKMNVTAHHQNTKIVEGYGLQFIETMIAPGGPAYHAVDLLGFDPGTSAYHLYTVDNFGDVHDHKGSWKDASRADFHHEGIVDGKPFVEDVTFTAKGPNAYGLSGTAKLGGQTIETFDLSFTRAGKSAGK